jgi:DNA-binding CsgD family transcriptional regulator
LYLVHRTFYQKRIGLGLAFSNLQRLQRTSRPPFCGEKRDNFAIPPLLTETGIRRVQRKILSRGRILMSLRRATLFIAIASFLAFRCLAQISIVKPVPARATIAVDAGKAAGAPIPRTIFGSFLEPIGNSTYNGLWAELLVNPSLEENLWSAKNLEKMVHDRPELMESSALGLPLPWEPLDTKQGNRYEPRWGNAANSWRSMVVMGVTGQPTGIKQEVYLPVQRTLSYRGSFFARHLSGPSTCLSDVLDRASCNSSAGRERLRHLLCKEWCRTAPRDRGCAVSGRHRRARSLEEIALPLLCESQPERQYPRRYRDSQLRSRFGRGGANAAKLEHQPERMVRSALTQREPEILEMVVRGLTNKQIGHALQISENTARNHINSIIRKLDVSGRTEAATAAIQQGLVRMPD